MVSLFFICLDDGALFPRLGIRSIRIGNENCKDFKFNQKKYKAQENARAQNRRRKRVIAHNLVSHFPSPHATKNKSGKSSPLLDP